jgi:hypothetical protein
LELKSNKRGISVGLFSGPPPAIDQRWESLIVPDGDKQKVRDRLVKAIAKSQGALEELDKRDKVAAIFANTWLPSQVVVVTESGVAVLDGSSIGQHYRFDEIGKTGIYTLASGCWVEVESWKALNDFMPDDSKRRAHIIKVNFDTPGPARRLCAMIDPHL